ncbi:Uncharacterised protein [Mycoplasmopsis maculosa]|uniref:ABC transporter substrate-binding protein PnrA-like domain-containing protein n=1 Tax=Mycoplasmopsis maculosa TaxID=114885 RepID=A0A449B522_9BACT|nr:BMP family ABC transporter substrate-binding protein [Mycoplasmopsis maculosa]VEU75707.1 Uncharacterised protein [Mycoplasmopsis maculosa]
MRKNKLFIPFLSTVSATSLVALSAACGTTVKEYTEEGKISKAEVVQPIANDKVDVAKGTVIEATVGSEKIKTLQTLSDITTQKFSIHEDYLTNGVIDYAKLPKIALFIDGGGEKDKSFNQSAWEALRKLSVQLGVDDVNYAKDSFNTFSEPGAANLPSAYLAAIKGGAKYIVLNGFTQGDTLKTFIAKASNQKLIKDNGVVFITIDFDESKHDFFVNNPGHILPVNFNTREAAWMAGYALAEYNKDNADATQRTLGAFGGLPFPGVTDFIVGILNGIIDANTEIEANTTTSIRDVINLKSGFEIGKTEATNAVNEIKESRAWFPVAGSITTYAASELRKTENAGKFLIGVDADQSLAIPENAFFTSVQKQVGQIVYNILGSLYQNKNVDSLYPGFVIGQANGPEKLSFGYSSVDKPQENYVKVAGAYMKDQTLTTKAQSFLTAATTKYSSEKQTILAKMQERFDASGAPSQQEDQRIFTYLNYLAGLTRTTKKVVSTATPAAPSAGSSSEGSQA